MTQHLQRALILTICLFWLASPVNANPRFVLDVTPHVCIVESEQKTCDLTIEVVVKSPEQQNYCLRLANTNEIHVCAKGSKTFSFVVSLSQSTSLTAIDDRQQVIAQHPLSIGYVVPNKYRRKRRLGWGI